MKDGGRSSWTRAWRSPAHDPVDENEERRLARQFGVEVCDSCGRTILMGEKVVHVHGAGGTEALCPDCVGRVAVRDAGRHAA